VGSVLEDERLADAEQRGGGSDFRATGGSHSMAAVKRKKLIRS